MDESNKKAHHTDMYNSSELILRRGQSCRLTLEFNKPLRDWQSIEFIARTGPQNTESQSTNVEFPLSSSWSSGMWSAVLESSPGNSLRIIMSSPANAVIGRYDLSVRIRVMNQTVTYSLGKFILLFNPWCLDDEVYMANEDERQEYVLNDHGVIFMGNEKHVTGMGWNYGQFENNILNICLDILDRSLNCQKDPAVDSAQRHSAIYIGRVISAMVNSNEDFGVLEGKWDKDFSEGVDPNSWNGSVEILWKWKNDNFKPVKYGQCWVFAAVMCTVLRCLGIPTRVITNFNSAHNTDGNMVIDMHYDIDGKFLELSDDSIWNFHVWNESWFLRPDLGAHYGGWQVLDSTPQEQSQGVHRCGPTSVIAVKEGDVHMSYDTPFVFAEVNADRATWVVQKDGTKERAHSDTKYVGQSISTKAVGSDSRLDVTHNYKYPEGSQQERDVFEKASRNMPKYVPPTENAVPDPKENVVPNPDNEIDRNRNDSLVRPSTPLPNSDRNSLARPSTPLPNSDRNSLMRPSTPLSNFDRNSLARPSTPLPNSDRNSLARPSTPLPNSDRNSLGRPSTPLPNPDRNERSSSPAPGQPPFANEYRSASPSRNILNEYGSAPPSRSILNEYGSAPPSRSILNEYGSAPPSRSILNEYRSASPRGLPNEYRSASPSRSLPNEYRSASPSRSLPNEYRSASPSRNVPNEYRSASPSRNVPNEYRSASPSRGLPNRERARSPSPGRFLDRPSPSEPLENEYRPASPFPNSLYGRPVSPAPFSGRPLQPHLGNDYRSTSPIPSSPAAERGRSLSPVPFSGRPSSTLPSGNEYRPGSPSPAPRTGRPLSPALFSGRPGQPRPRNEYRSASSLPSSPIVERRRPMGSEYRPSSPSPSTPIGRPSSSAMFPGYPSSAPLSENEYRPSSPSPSTPIGRPSSSSMFSGYPSSASLSGNGYRPASPSPSPSGAASGRSSSPIPFSSRSSASQPTSEYWSALPSPSSGAPNGRPSSPSPFSGYASPTPPPGPAYRPASPSPATPAGRPLSPSLASGHPSHASNSANSYWPESHSTSTSGYSSSASSEAEITGKFKLLSPLVVGDDINLLLILTNHTPYHRPVKVHLSASATLYTGRRVNDIFTDQKSLIISPSQDAHISVQIPYSLYSRGIYEGNMIQIVAVCELPFGTKVVITKDLVLENPPITIKPLSNAVLHKTMALEIRFTNPLQMAVNDCTLVVEGSGLVDRQLVAVVPYLKPKEKIKFRVELTPYRSGLRQLIANFKCKHFSIRGYQLLNVDSW